MIRDILRSDIPALIKLFALVVAALLFITPGGLILLFEFGGNLLSQNVIILLATCAIISIPFHFLGTLAYLGPYKTLEELSNKGGLEVALNLFLGGIFWSIASSVATYAGANYFYFFIFDTTYQNVYIRYAAIYLLLFAMYGVVFYFNSSRLKRNIRR